MFEWFSWLIETVPFQTNNPESRESIARIHSLANLNIAIAYFFINFALAWIWWRNRKVKKSWILLSYFLFIFSSGNSRLFYGFVYDFPAYRLLVLLDIFVAVSAWFTAIAVPFVLWKRFKLPEDKLKETENILSEVLEDKTRIHKEKNRLAALLARSQLTILHLREQVRTLKAIKESLSQKTDLDDVIHTLNDVANQMEETNKE